MCFGDKFFIDMHRFHNSAYMVSWGSLASEAIRIQPFELCLCRLHFPLVCLSLHGWHC